MPKNRNPKASGVIALLVLVCVGGAPSALAQEGQNPASTPSSAPSASPQSQTTSPQTPPEGPPNPPPNGASTPQKQAADPSVPQNDRILWALPNYLTVENVSSLPPMSVGQKFKLVAQGTFDPIEFAFLALEAGVNQASNTNPTFGQGFKGYGKRYALALADNTVENFMVGAVFPSLLHQDPRFYQMGKGKFLHRVAYAGLRVFVTRTDAGKRQFNFSEIFGAATAAAISDTYHPGPRTLGSGISVWGTQVGWDAVSFELKEFWPDIHHYLVRRFHKS